MKLSAHFSIEELTHSDTAVRNGIDNTPTEEIYQNLLILAAGLERTREVLGFPMHASSGYRCEALEKIIARKDFLGWCARRGIPASDPTSWPTYFARKAHPKGLALDFIAPQFGTPEEVVEVIAAEADYIGFDSVIFEGSWVHIAFPASGKGKGEVLTAKFDANGVSSYTKGIKA